MERAVEGGQAAYPEFGFSAGGRGADFGLTAPGGRGGGAYSIAPICCCMRANINSVRGGWLVLPGRGGTGVRLLVRALVPFEGERHEDTGVACDSS